MRKKVLLIEDDKILRENTAEILGFANYEVITAANGKIGIEKALRIIPDIIICDIMMPRLDGYGVLKILSQNMTHKHIPFVFLSSKSSNVDRRKAMELGADDYLVKPFDESDLLTVIETRLNKVIKSRDLTFSENRTTSDKSYQKIETLQVLIEKLCNKKTYTYKKGETLYCEGNSSQHIYLIKEGIVKTFKNTEAGKELITGLYLKRQFLGYTSSFGNFPHNENAEALCDLKIVKIDRTEIKNILESNPHLTIDLLSLLSNSIENYKDKLLHIAYGSVRMRVAKTLLLVSKANSLRSIFINRSDLANLTGVAKETLIRTLSDFKEEGLIITERNSIVIIDDTKLDRIK